MRSKWFAVLSIVVLASMVLASCQTAAPATPTAVVAGPAKETLRVNLGTFPDIIDPQVSSFVNEIAHLQMSYEGLTRLDKNLKTVPGAAEKWVYNADASEITFTLRANLKYSDGTLLNAKRYEYSIMRNINPVTAGQYAAITDEIAGAAAWRTADTKKLTADELAKLKAAVKVMATDAKGVACKDYAQVDCNTLKITLGAPAPYYHTVMSLWVTYPAKEELITAGGASWWKEAKNHLGNGAFIMKTLTANEKGEFIPNPFYWAGKASYNVEYRYITDSAVAFAAYKNNEFDVVGLAAEDLKTVTADAVLSKQKTVYPGACTYALMFHQLKEPFTDPKIREAFAYALDRETWVKDILQGLGSSTLTWIPKGYPGYDAAESRWGYDVEKAKKAIADSTYKSIDKLPPITFTFSDSARNRTRWEWLAAKYKANLGIDVKLAPTEPTAYTALTKDVKTAPQAFLLGWCADYPDPQNWLSVYWMGGSSFASRIGYTNADLDKVMKSADTTLDDVKRMGLYDQAQKQLTAGIPVAFFWNNVQAFMVKPSVKGYNPTPQDHGFPGSNDLLSISITR